ncbi:hypothetical protein ACQR1I_36350 [Bradyrhizobium sp. HKCCYLS2038]|uniref:hypothetical protein n=1 Tax=Bradyrhizobium sp. HKCCYLS2038 TaxID=3420764 RepID=UPI003EBCB4A2
MADLTITAANVLASGQADKETGTAGATVTAGQPVYKEAATGLFKLLDVDSATAEARVYYGTALHGSLNGQPLTVAKSDPNFTPGASGMTVGARLYGSSTPGGIAPEADITTGKYVVQLGVVTSATTMNLRPFNSGVVVP